MSRIRFAKVRRSDFRPAAGAPRTTGALTARPGAAASPAGMSGLDHLAARQRREAEEHDRNVQNYTPQMAEAAYNDLHGRTADGLDYMETSWIKARRAALLRLGARMKQEGRA